MESCFCPAGPSGTSGLPLAPRLPDRVLGRPAPSPPLPHDPPPVCLANRPTAAPPTAATPPRSAHPTRFCSTKAPAWTENRWRATDLSEKERPSRKSGGCFPPPGTESRPCPADSSGMNSRRGEPQPPARG